MRAPLRPDLAAVFRCRPRPPKVPPAPMPPHAGVLAELDERGMPR